MLSYPNTNQPIDFIPYLKHKFPDWQLSRFSPHEQQMLIQRGIAARDWDELQALIQTLGNQ